MRNFMSNFVHICVFIVFFHTYSVLASDKNAKSEVKNVKQDIEVDIKATPKTELEKAAFEKMNSKEIAQYLIEKQAIKKGLPVDVIIPVTFFAVPVISLFLFSIFRFKTTKEKQQTLRVMVENGVQIPPEMFMEPKKETETMELEPKERDRRRGILLTLSSLAFIIFIIAIGQAPKGAWSIGLIPLFLGFGYLINFKLASSNDKKE